MDEKNGRDELFIPAINLFIANGGKASVSMFQRKFKIGYNRAARLMDQLEEAGVVGPANENGLRELLIEVPVQKEFDKAQVLSNSQPVRMKETKKSAKQNRRRWRVSGRCPRCGSSEFHYVLRDEGSSSTTKYYRHHRRMSYIWSAGRRKNKRQRHYGVIGFCPNCGYRKESVSIGTIIIGVLFIVFLVYVLLHIQVTPSV